MIMLVMMDLSAAFDTVDHELLLTILTNSYGIAGDALKWYSSYLRPRLFAVKIGETTSKPMDLQFRVTQGSASGANPFVAYCESLFDIYDNPLILQGFAVHDSFSPNSSKDELNTKLRIEEAMCGTFEWMREMRLKLNTDKTEFLIIHHPKQLRKCATTHNTVGSDRIELLTMSDA